MCQCQIRNTLKQDGARKRTRGVKSGGAKGLKNFSEAFFKSRTREGEPGEHGGEVDEQVGTQKHPSSIIRSRGGTWHVNDKPRHRIQSKT